jgi:hypothetical protein
MVRRTNGSVVAYLLMIDLHICSTCCKGFQYYKAQEHTPPLILGMRVSSTEAGRPSTMLSLCTVAQAGLFLRAARLTFPSVIYLPALRSTTLSAWCWLLQHQPGADDDFINP